MQKTEIADNISDRIGNVFLQQLKESPDMDLWYQQIFTIHYLMEWREKIWLYKQQVKSKWNSEKSSIIP